MIMKTFSFIPVLAAALSLALPATGLSDHKVTVYRDRDGDGHYNKKTYDTHYRDYHGHHGYYGGYGYGGYGYRPYYGYGYPRYYGYGPSVGVSISRPSYYVDEPVYRGRVTSSASDDLAMDVQTALRRRGYYRGSIDGDIGPGTRAAIRAYQADRGLTVTGRIDRSLVRSLGIG